MDMAGFAVNVRLIVDHPIVAFRMTAGRGNQESDLLTQLGVELTDLEPKANNCREVITVSTIMGSQSWYFYIFMNTLKYLKIH